MHKPKSNLPDWKINERKRRIIAIRRLLLILVFFGGLHYATYSFHFGIASFETMYKKWRGQTCFKSFCFNPAIHEVQYGRPVPTLFGGRNLTSVRFCLEHYKEPLKTVPENFKWVWYIFSFFGLTAGILLVISLTKFCKWLRHPSKYSEKMLLEETLMTNINLFLWPSLGACL